MYLCIIKKGFSLTIIRVCVCVWMCSNTLQRYFLIGFELFLFVLLKLINVFCLFVCFYCCWSGWMSGWGLRGFWACDKDTRNPTASILRKEKKKQKQITFQAINYVRNDWREENERSIFDFRWHTVQQYRANGVLFSFVITQLTLKLNEMLQISIETDDENKK